LVSLDKKRAIDFLFLLSRADPPVISPARTKQFFRDAGRVIRITPKVNRREQAKHAAFEWMRAVQQKTIRGDVLRRQIGDLPDLAPLLHHLYDGRLGDRNTAVWRVLWKTKPPCLRPTGKPAAWHAASHTRWKFPTHP
jgi:hypothetical protein